MSDPAIESPIRIRFGLFAALLALLLVGRFGLVLLGIDSFMLRDFNRFGYPLAAYVHDSFQAGILPLWNPYNHCGLPFLAQWNTLVCYPPSLLYCLFPVSWALNVFCLLHLYAAGLGMFTLARHWSGSDAGAALAGVAYCFGGLLINSLTWPNNIAAFGCLPWVVWSVDRALDGERGWMLRAILIGALQMLSGAPEVILCTWAIIAFHRLAERLANRPSRIRFSDETRRAGLIIAGVAGLAMAQLLPFFELLRHSSRSGGMTNDGWSLPWHFWVNYLVPLFRVGQRVDGVLFLEGQAWTHSYYAGVSVLLLAVFGLLPKGSSRARALALLALAGMILGLGNKGLLYRLFTGLGPIAMMRYPVKFLILPTVIIPLLAAFGLRAITSARNGSARARSLVPAGLGLAAVFGLIAWLITRPATGDYGMHRDLAWRSWGLALCWTVCVLSWIGFHLRRPGVTHAGLGVLAAVVALDLLTHQPRLAPTVPRAYWTEPIPIGLNGRPPTLSEGRVAITPAVQYVQLYQPTASMEDNLIGSRASLPSNLNLLTRTPRVEGFYSLTFAEMFEVQKKLYTDLSTPRQSVADFLCVRQYLVKTNGFAWREHPTALPLVTAGQAPVFTTATNIPTLLTAEDYDPRQFVFFDQADADRVQTRANAPARVSELEIEEHRVAFRVNSPAPTIAVIAQAHYPAWQATVNGRPAELLRANNAFQALNIPAGETNVELRYRDRPFQAGLAISLTSLLVLVGIEILRRRRLSTRP